jgi:hypothetical protein
MPRERETSVQISDFAGLVVNADPIDVAEGAASDQVNCTSIIPGELRVRGGVKIVNFEDF